MDTTCCAGEFLFQGATKGIVGAFVRRQVEANSGPLGREDLKVRRVRKFHVGYVKEKLMRAKIHLIKKGGIVKLEQLKFTEGKAFELGGIHANARESVSSPLNKGRFGTVLLISIRDYLFNFNRGGKRSQKKKLGGGSKRY